MSGLRSLDDRWLPRLAARVHRLRHRVRAFRSRHERSAEAVTTVVHEEPALVGSIAAVLVAAVLIAISGGDRVVNGPRPGQSVTDVPPPVIATLGPAPGTAVATYLTRAAYDLRHFSDIAAGRSTYAVVDLRHYLTPVDVQSLFAGAEVVRAYVRVPSQRLPTQVRSVPLSSIGDLAAGLQTAAQVARATAQSYAALLRTFHPRTRVDRQTRRHYAEQHRAAVLETGQLGHAGSCRCVFAVVLRAGVGRLAALATQSEVRAVDPASPLVELSSLTVLPLDPRVQTMVPRTGLLGG